MKPETPTSEDGDLICAHARASGSPRRLPSNLRTGAQRREREFTRVLVLVFLRGPDVESP